MKPSDMRKPYTGSTRSLVIALDVGTTFSGVSYAILEPGEIPKIYGVTRYVPSFSLSLFTHRPGQISRPRARCREQQDPIHPLLR